jgi:ankyrin repeat protein
METLENKTPLEMAAEYDHLEVVQTYLQRHQSENSPEGAVNVLIQAAVRNLGTNVLSNLIPMANDVPYGLHAACRQPRGHRLLSDSKISQYLITKHNLLQQYREDGFGPLMIAVKYRRKECVKILLDSGLCDEQVFAMRSLALDRTVLHICAEIKHAEITDGLLKKIAATNCSLTPTDAMGNTPLHLCVQVNNVYMSDQLLTINKKNCAAANDTSPMLTSKNNDGYTAFQLAMVQGRYEIVEAILSSVVDKDKFIAQKDAQLRTPLHTAALVGKEEGFSPISQHLSKTS